MSTLTYNFGDGDQSAAKAITTDPQWKVWDDHDGTKEQRLIKTAVFIAYFWKENRYGPTLREIQGAMEIASLTTIREDLAALSKGGYVTYIPRQARTLVPTDKLLSHI
jgi:SOS-response transcriptional repressor LexA